MLVIYGYFRFTSFKVTTGGIDTTSQEPSERTQMATWFKVHENYDPVTYVNNIALLQIAPISSCNSEYRNNISNLGLFAHSFQT
jgi:hypothetical protein